MRQIQRLSRLIQWNLFEGFKSLSSGRRAPEPRTQKAGRPDCFPRDDQAGALHGKRIRGPSPRLPPSLDRESNRRHRRPRPNSSRIVGLLTRRVREFLGSRPSAMSPSTNKLEREAQASFFVHGSRLLSFRAFSSDRRDTRVMLPEVVVQTHGLISFD